MARPISVEPLSLQNFTVGQDSIKVKFNWSKADQEGDRCGFKHVYANPHNPTVCPFLALGIYLSTNSMKFENTPLLFQDSFQATKKKSSKKYTDHLTQLFIRHEPIVRQFMRPHMAKPYGLRKGPASYATSGTTVPPPITSVAGRAEWSLGKVLDVYMHFMEPGDHYLGRILSGLDPMQEEFCALPPHFNVDNPLENADIMEGIELCFGNITKHWGSTKLDPMPMLLFLLASMVYHNNFVVRMKTDRSYHVFTYLPLYNRQDLVERLQQIVTIKPSTKIPYATGIPPHIENSVKMRQVLSKLNQILTGMLKQYDTIQDSIKNAFEEHAIASGHISREGVQNILTNFQEEMLDKVQYMTNTVKEFGVAENNNNDEDIQFPIEYTTNGVEEGTTVIIDRKNYGLYSYVDPDDTSKRWKNQPRLWMVPLDYEFPKVNLKTGLNLWLTGLRTRLLYQ